MATKRLVKVTDDLDGSEAAELVRFSIDGASYEIDLGARNRARLDSALAPYIERGRRVSAARGRRRLSRRGSGVENAAVRAGPDRKDGRSPSGAGSAPMSSGSTRQRTFTHMPMAGCCVSVLPILLRPEPSAVVFRGRRLAAAGSARRTLAGSGQVRGCPSGPRFGSCRMSRTGAPWLLRRGPGRRS
jgi:Lsr2